MRASSLAEPLLALLMIVTGASAAPPPSRTDPPVVIIVTSQAVEPFQEATQGIKLALGSAARLITVDSSSTPEELSARLGAKDISLLVTVGTWTIGSLSDKWVKFLVTGKNASSGGYNVAIDYIKLTPQ